MAFLVGAVIVTGCGNNQTNVASGKSTGSTETVQKDVNSFLEQLDTSAMFTERDMEQVQPIQMWCRLKMISFGLQKKERTF